MIQVRWGKALVVAFTCAGLALGGSPMTPVSAPVETSAPEMIPVPELGKDKKAQVVRSWHQQDGKIFYEIIHPDTGERMILIDQDPAIIPYYGTSMDNPVKPARQIVRWGPNSNTVVTTSSPATGPAPTVLPAPPPVPQGTVIMEGPEQKKRSLFRYGSEGNPSMPTQVIMDSTPSPVINPTMPSPVASKPIITTMPQQTFAPVATPPLTQAPMCPPGTACPAPKRSLFSMSKETSATYPAPASSPSPVPVVASLPASTATVPAPIPRTGQPMVPAALAAQTPPPACTGPNCQADPNAAHKKRSLFSWSKDPQPSPFPTTVQATVPAPAPTQSADATKKRSLFHWEHETKANTTNSLVPPQASVPAETTKQIPKAQAPKVPEKVAVATPAPKPPLTMGDKAKPANSMTLPGFTGTSAAANPSSKPDSLFGEPKKPETKSSLFADSGWKTVAEPKKEAASSPDVRYPFGKPGDKVEKTTTTKLPDFDKLPEPAKKEEKKEPAITKTVAKPEESKVTTAGLTQGKNTPAPVQTAAAKTAIPAASAAAKGPVKPTHLPTGTQSVLAASGAVPGAVVYVPVPMMTQPPIQQAPKPPMPPAPQIPQPPKTPVLPGTEDANNAFLPMMPPLQTPPGPNMTGGSNAFGAPQTSGNESAGAFGGPPAMPPQGYGYPMAQGMYPMPYGQAMPQRMPAYMPNMYPGMNPAMMQAAYPQAPYAYPQTGNIRAAYVPVPANYQGYFYPQPMPNYPTGQNQVQPEVTANKMPASNPNVVPAGYSEGTDEIARQLMRILHDSLYPSERERAADNLTTRDWRAYPQVVDALVKAALEDPAATVRTACVRGLGRMQCNTVPVINALQTLKTDKDPRVRNEVEQILPTLGGNGSK